MQAVVQEDLTGCGIARVALLATKWHLEHGRPFWHWAVFRRGQQGAVVFDPKRALRSNTRTNFGRIRPKWFIAISPHRDGQA